MVFSKARNWKYEKELRVFKNFNGKQPYKKKALRQIIFGWKMLKSYKHKLIEIAKDGRFSNVKFKKIIPTNNQFGLKIIDYEYN